MRRLLILLLLGCCLASSLLAMTDGHLRPIGQLLEELDDAIAHKGQYQQRRQMVSDSLLRATSQASGQERINLLWSLIYNYENYLADSTLLMLEMLKQTPEYPTDTTLQRTVYISEARAYGVKGLYSTALDMLNSFDPTGLDDYTRLHYYNVRYAVTGWFANFAKRYSPQLSKSLTESMLPINDTIYSLEPDALNRRIIRTNKYLIGEQYQTSMDSIRQEIEAIPADKRTHIYSILAQAYGKLGHKEEELRYLTLTAISDIRQGNTEYMALPILAQRTFELGQNERAYRYLICTLEDANFCKASLRTIEATEIFPIIEHAMAADEKRQSLFKTWAIVILSVLMLLMFVGLYLLRRQHKKLNHTRQLLAQANNDLKVSNLQLKDFNQELISADKVKEEYIMRYLSRCRRYLGSLESFQRQMYKLMQTRQLEELARQLKSTAVINDEQEHFYRDFDEAFLNLYPHFIEKFNKLLREDAQILPKKGELLTTELRIFALIRLGETDSAQIAKFLNYSVTTIYNYRSRTRNNALKDKENFENQVMQL